MDLDIERFADVTDQLPNLKTVQMCGTYGDPIAAANLDQFLDICIDKSIDIVIHTNGSLKTAAWWERLGIRFKDLNCSVIFGIDGLEGIHELHRQGTNFKKIIENATAFINAGGKAEWKFLLFEHNKHQVKDCLRLSRQLGFKRFFTRNSIRINDDAKNYLTGEPYVIKRVEEFKTIESEDDNDKIVDVKDCMHLNIPSAYLNANGLLTTCCYIRDVPYEGNTIDREIPNNPIEYCRLTCGRSKN
jgi:sulfatase maturation enzyme AslB (radical SAM superfamily)